MSASLLTRPRRRPELNLVPLIDVLVMLIFVAFVTMQIKKPTTLNITLPKASSAGSNVFKNGVTISIGKDGTLAFNDRVIRDDELEALLVDVHNRAGADSPIIVKGDEDSQLKKLVFVADACRQAGLSHYAPHVCRRRVTDLACRRRPGYSSGRHAYRHYGGDPRLGARVGESGTSRTGTPSAAAAEAARRSSISGLPIPSRSISRSSTSPSRSRSRSGLSGRWATACPIS